MKITKTNIILVGIVIGLILIAFICGKCSTREERSQQIDNLAAARDSIHESFIVIDGLRNTVYSQDAIILSKDEAINVGLLELERLKKLHLKEIITNTELQGRINILEDSLSLRPGTIIITIKDTLGISFNYMKIPFELPPLNNKWIFLSAGVDSLSLAWYKSSAIVSGEMTIGYQKNGFLKSKPIGIFTTENPYLKINQMDITIIKEKKKWFDKTWVHMAFGAGIFEGARLLITK